MRGGPDHDSMHGGASDDMMNGDTGGDILFGDDGADVMWGGRGSTSQTTPPIAERRLTRRLRVRGRGGVPTSGAGIVTGGADVIDYLPEGRHRPAGMAERHRRLRRRGCRRVDCTQHSTRASTGCTAVGTAT